MKNFDRKTTKPVNFPILYHDTDPNQPEYGTLPHHHTELEILRVLQGTLQVYLGSRMYRAKSGDILIIHSEMLHSSIPDNCIYESALVSPTILKNFPDFLSLWIERFFNGEWEIEVHHKHKSDRFSETVNEMFDALKKKPEGYEFLAIGALCTMFGIILNRQLYHAVTESAEKFRKNTPKLKKILHHIHDNFEQPLTLSDLATTAGMSPKYFCRYFKEQVGHTPMEYLIRYRIESASRLLLETDLSVTEIAFSCGFNDLSYFIKTFKSQKGISPSGYRKNHVTPPSD